MCKKVSAHKPGLDEDWKLTKGRKVRFALVRNGEGSIIDYDIYATLRIRGIEDVNVGSRSTQRLVQVPQTLVGSLMSAISTDRCQPTYGGPIL